MIAHPLQNELIILKNKANEVLLFGLKIYGN